MLLGLAIKALLIALVPLTAVWLARGGDRYRKLAWVTAFFTFDLIVFGGFTRLTDSGLGCPDWPGCYGEANPFLAHADISAAQAALPTGPVTVFKAWIEMIHRYLAMGVGVMIIALLAISWHLWRRTREARYAPALPAVLLLWVCVQGAFGAWTVTLKLQPIIVTMHLLLGIGLLAMLVWHAMRQTPAPAIASGNASLRLPAAIALVVLFMQIALGGWVSTNYAALACGGFPLCQGELMPAMDFAHGFTLWRELGMTRTGDYLPFDALVAVNWVHRMFAFVVVAVIGYVGWRAARGEGTARIGRWLWLVILVQFGTGIATVALNWPLTIAVLHNAGAALSVALLTMLNCRLAGQQAGSAEAVRVMPHPA
jgi:cytochrome c oxidase assembly protein subunit 15